MIIADIENYRTFEIILFRGLKSKVNQYSIEARKILNRALTLYWPSLMEVESTIIHTSSVYTTSYHR